MTAFAETAGGSEQPGESLIDYVEQLDQTRDKLFTALAAYADKPIDKRAGKLSPLSEDLTDDFRACAMYILETEPATALPHSQITGILLGEEQKRGQFLRTLTPGGSFVGKYDEPDTPEFKAVFNTRNESRRHELAGILLEGSEDDADEDAFIEAALSLFVSNMEDDIEEFEEQATQLPAARRRELAVTLGGHALDVLKASGGVMIGIWIMRQRPAKG